MKRVTMLTVLLKMLTVTAVVTAQQEEQFRQRGDSEVQHARFRRHKLHPHTYLLTPELIQARGYPAEVHHVITDDGYILEMHRIPHSPYSSQQELNSLNSVLRSLLVKRRTGIDINNITSISADNVSKKFLIHSAKKVVFLMHCVLCSSADFVMNDPDQALAFVLADAGYDVWLGNGRGNIYGRRHVFLSPSQTKFWNFSWDEMAKYDVPSMLAYVRKSTGVDQVNYVGHSMGTTIFFSMMNYHPHINSWIRAMVALAPVAYMHNKRSPLRFFSPIANSLDTVLTHKGLAEFGRLTKESAAFYSTLCSPSSVLHMFCQMSFAFIGGPNNSKYLDDEYFPVFFAHTPAGTSIHVLTHFLQLVKAKQFQPFDYGVTRNMQEYGLPFPPPFTLSAVTAPIAAFYAQNDWIADKTDVQQTLRELPNVVFSHRVEVDDFNHMDFLWAENAGYLVYRQLIEFLNMYNS